MDLTGLFCPPKNAKHWICISSTVTMDIQKRLEFHQKWGGVSQVHMPQSETGSAGPNIIVSLNYSQLTVELLRCVNLCKCVINSEVSAYSFLARPCPLYLPKVITCMNGFVWVMILNFADSLSHSSSVTLLENRLNHSSFLFHYSDNDSHLFKKLPFCHQYLIFCHILGALGCFSSECRAKNMSRTSANSL